MPQANPSVKLGNLGRKARSAKCSEDAGEAAFLPLSFFGDGDLRLGGDRGELWRRGGERLRESRLRAGDRRRDGVRRESERRRARPDLDRDGSKRGISGKRVPGDAADVLYTIYSIQGREISCMQWTVATWSCIQDQCNRDPASQTA